MQNNAPVSNDPQGGAPQDPKLLKQKKKEEAEKAKRLQQEKRRQVELNMQLGTFSRILSTSVMDTSTMMKLTCNTLKSMLQCDHVALSMFEDHPEIRQGIICLGKSESNLPKLPPPPQIQKKDDKPKIKRMMVGDEVIEIVEKVEKPKIKEEEKDKEPETPKPMFPVAPREPFKPGTLPRLEYIIWDIPLMYKMKDIKQPAMIPDPSKFPDPELVKFTGIYLIKSILFVPLNGSNVGENNEETVVGVLAAMNVNEPKVFTQTEITFAQKIMQALSKAVTSAPPDLPINVKKVITSISKDEASDRLVDFYSTMLDDIFDLIVYEMHEDCPPIIHKLIEDSHKIEHDSKLKKIWFQIYELVRAEGNLGNIAKRAIHENFEQVSEFIKAKSAVMPKGFKNLNAYVRKNLRYEDIKNLFDSEEMEEVVDVLDEQIYNALRGQALFTDKEKATLINDVEQANMLLNYISAPSAVDFRNHIKAAMEEVTDYPEDVDKDALLTELTYHGLSEISKSVCQDLVEKALFEIPQYLEQSQEKQADQSETLVSHFHVKIMSNLVTCLKGKKSVWANHVSHEIKEKAKEAAKKRAVLVGRLKTDIEEEEDY